jgi:ferredoxin
MYSNNKEKSYHFSRRKFISSCAACGTCMAISPLSGIGLAPTVVKDKKMKIKIIYSLHELVQPGPDWPNYGFNFYPIIKNNNIILKKQFPSFEFISAIATGEEDAKKILQQDMQANIDGYIIYQMNCWNKVVQTIAKSEKPVLYVDFKYGGSGGFLTYNAKFLRDKQSNIGFVSSSHLEDLIAAVKSFNIIAKGGTVNDFVNSVTNLRLQSIPSSGNLSYKTDILETLSADESLRRMKESRILAVRDQNARSAEPIMGIPLEYISFAEVNQAWENADLDETNEIAERWINNSSEVIDVPFTEIQNSAAMYLGMKSVMKNHHANAITINCLGGFYGGHIHAYPCLGFHELNNQGLVGACECDIRSTATMVAFTTMTKGRPGYISDPVIDTSKRQIIYAHCVAPNKMFGPNGSINPYVIISHSEDRKGAAVRSIMPTGYLTTSLKIDQDKKEIVFHQAKAVENDSDSRACRTKLCAEPIGDMEKLFTEWDRWGWHRVTFYGDLKEPIYELADSIGWKVIEEA